MDKQRGTSARWLQSLESIVARLDKGFIIVAGFLLVTMMLMISANVFTRFLFGISLAWSLEISEYMLLYISLLVAPWILRNNGHISFDLFYSNASPRTKKVLDIISYILGIAVCIILTVFGSTVTWDHYVRDVILYNTILMPKFILLLVIPVSGALMLLEFIRKLLHELSSVPSDSTEETA